MACRRTWFQIVPIKTTGDRVLDRPLSQIGGKGLFTREIEEALTEGAIDIAVHSMKDMPTLQPDGLVIDCLLPARGCSGRLRQPERSLDHRAAAGRGRGLLQPAPPRPIGTPSSRSAVGGISGECADALQKLADGVAVATFLAMAGLSRLDMRHVAQSAIDPDEMLPAVAQGAIGIERRADDQGCAMLLSSINDPLTALRIEAERAFLRRLDGSCQTPIAGLATLNGGRMTLRGENPAPGWQRGRRRCP